jgi:hypothetical protein
MTGSGEKLDLLIEIKYRTHYPNKIKQQFFPYRKRTP